MNKRDGKHVPANTIPATSRCLPNTLNRVQGPVYEAPVLVLEMRVFQCGTWAEWPIILGISKQKGATVADAISRSS